MSVNFIIVGEGEKTVRGCIMDILNALRRGERTEPDLRWTKRQFIQEEMFAISNIQELGKV